MTIILRKWWADIWLPTLVGLTFGVIIVVGGFQKPANSDFVRQSDLVEAKMDACVDGLINLLAGNPVQVFHLAQMRFDCKKRTALDSQIKVMGLSQ